MKNHKFQLPTFLLGSVFLVLTSVGLGFISKKNPSAQNQPQVVRMAKLKIHPEMLDNYKAFLKEEIETSVRIEPGVLALNAVSDKNDPTSITILEIYANQAAYLAHLETAHFLKYKNGTSQMVKSLELVEVEEIALRSKTK
ncbi:putative quinol monooxygenase [Algoriphagus yeomjeoni]|uniref:Quinol monooxygenase YgiN n=1 Tax=Algoriphagus yeomjeoni TaxID=291403 RepID=A0A327PIB6_9BACT|nr:putative quinol monooxygenase [Algoriphagus yeomjeoni]RAI92025.1 quinol monooxygenase YgiN [Algoriphagus yeomjeoni]